jgi:hypothetical protein
LSSRFLGLPAVRFLTVVFHRTCISRIRRPAASRVFFFIGVANGIGFPILAAKIDAFTVPPRLFCPACSHSFP